MTMVHTKSLFCARFGGSQPNRFRPQASIKVTAKTGQTILEDGSAAVQGTCWRTLAQFL